MAVTEGLDYVPLDGRLGSATMEGSSNATGVTPQAVRAGDPAALQTLVERRGPAVVAFCTLICGPQMATQSAAEAFARFRAAVRDALEVDGLDPEVLLRGATRHAAASMARTPVGPPPHGRLRSRGTQTCEHVPTMLAARANGALGDADLDRLARHLDRCERCDAMAEIFRRGELAYQDPPFDTLGTETSSALLEALEAVPAHGLGHAPAPGPDAPATERLDGAFGHLPDLDDEVPLDATVAFDVAQVDAPAEQLDAADLVAEPLPDEAPPAPDAEELHAGDEDFDADHEELDADGDTGEYELVYGNTAEWDQLTQRADEAEAGGDADVSEDDVSEDHGPDEHLSEDAVAAEPLAGEPLAGEPLAGVRRRRGGGRLLTVVLPALVVAICVAGALAWSGVFGGSDPTPPQVEHRAAAGIQPPVITPLPVKVRATAPHAAVPPAGGAATSSTTPATTTP